MSKNKFANVMLARELVALASKLIEGAVPSPIKELKELREQKIKLEKEHFLVMLKHRQAALKEINAAFKKAGLKQFELANGDHWEILGQGQSIQEDQQGEYAKALKQFGGTYQVRGSRRDGEWLAIQWSEKVTDEIEEFEDEWTKLRFHERTPWALKQIEPSKDQSRVW